MRSGPPSLLVYTLYLSTESIVGGIPVIRLALDFIPRYKVYIMGVETMDRTLTIGQVAKQAGVNTQTLRYYEREGYLRPAGYRESGYRLYRNDAVRRILFIKNAQALGFTLKEINQLLKLRLSRNARCGAVRARAQDHLKDVQTKIKRLQAIERILSELVRICHRRGTTDNCPILKSIEAGRNGRKSEAST